MTNYKSYFGFSREPSSRDLPPDQLFQTPGHGRRKRKASAGDLTLEPVRPVPEVDAHLEVDYLEFIARVTSHIPDKGQVTARYFGLYANAHRGQVRKAQPDKHPFIIVEEESPRIPRRGWAEMIRKVYEVSPMCCPQCQGEMRVIAFLTDYAVVDRIIAHLKLTFVAERPPPPHVACQELWMAAETSAEYFS